MHPIDHISTMRTVEYLVRFRHEEKLTGVRVCREAKHNLRRAIPPCANVIGQVRDLLNHVIIRCYITSCKSEVAYSDRTTTVDQDVPWLEVSMHNITSVYKLRCWWRLFERSYLMDWMRPGLTTQNLVHKICHVVVTQLLPGADDLVKIGFSLLSLSTRSQ